MRASSKALFEFSRHLSSIVLLRGSLVSNSLVTGCDESVAVEKRLVRFVSTARVRIFVEERHELGRRTADSRRADVGKSCDRRCIVRKRVDGGGGRSLNG